MKFGALDLHVCCPALPIADIIFNRGTLDINDFSRLERYDEGKACRRLCAVLKSSPHLIPFIRRIRASLEPGVLQPLAKFDFPNLHDIVFHRRKGGAASEETITLAAQLIGLPSIRRVVLLSPMFNGTQDFIRLFENTHLPWTPSSWTRKLRWDLNNRYAAPVFHPFLPLDLSAVVDLDLGGLLSPDIRQLVKVNRGSLRRLTLDAQHVVNNDYCTDPQPAFLVGLGALTHLKIITTAHEIADAETLLAHLPLENNLRSLTLGIRKVRQVREGQLRALGAACANLNEACIVTVDRHRPSRPTDGTKAGRRVARPSTVRGSSLSRDARRNGTMDGTAVDSGRTVNQQRALRRVRLVQQRINVVRTSI
ncbi:hypothetical protein B0H14DRAFT_3425415 [Mycena olivaceomarginata]|nr:hypothetical protein B0H14DRAFT_3425415 [Mycena olivaceomarginata]